MASIVIYTTQYCPYCRGAKSLLNAKGVEFEEIDVTTDPDGRAEMMKLSGRQTVPQIFVDGRPIGGFDDMRLLDSSGELDRILAGKQ